MDKKLVVYVLAALVATALLFALAANPPRGTSQPAAPPMAGHEEFHAHFDFKLFVDGQPVDLSQERFQAVEGHELSEDVHLHDHDGNVVHLHNEGVTVDQFLDSLGLSQEGKKVRTFVNGEETPRGLAYQFKDLDRVLVSVGASTDEEIVQQLASVTDRACIYSEKCPERGKPPTETCVGQCKIG